MPQHDVRSRLYLNTFAAGCDEIASRWQIGLEITSLCLGAQLDDTAAVGAAVTRWGRSELPLILHGPFHDLAPGSIDPAIVDVVERRFEQAVAVAGALGTNRVTLHSGYQAYAPDQWLGNAVRFWRRFLASKPEELRIYVENVDDPQPEVLQGLVDAVGDPRLMVCLDVGHANKNSCVPLAEWIAVLGPRIGHVHLHNNDGLHDRHWRLDWGTIDMNKTIEALLTDAPTASLTLECADEEASLEWLSANGYLV